MKARDRIARLIWDNRHNKVNGAGLLIAGLALGMAPDEHTRRQVARMLGIRLVEKPDGACLTTRLDRWLQ